MTAGGPLRAATILLGSSDEITAMANTPVSSLHRLADRFLQRYAMPVAVGVQVLLDQVGDDFGVGLGAELVAFLDQLALQADVVLDDAVVHDNDLAGAVAMRMGVLFGGTSVRGPAGVADAVGAVERLQADDLFQIAQLALGAAHLQPFAVAGNRDAGRVIAAILQPPQAVDDDRHHPLLPNITDNATHSSAPWSRTTLDGRMTKEDALEL